MFVISIGTRGTRKVTRLGRDQMTRLPLPILSIAPASTGPTPTPPSTSRRHSNTNQTVSQIFSIFTFFSLTSALSRIYPTETPYLISYLLLASVPVPTARIHSTMDSPQRPGGNGDDGPGRPPRKVADNPQDDADNTNDRQPAVVDAFGDHTDLPAWAFLLLAALFSEHLRSLYHCSC